MSERRQDERRPAPSAFEDPTRDIRLPAMPDRPPAAIPRAWAGLAHRPASDAPSPDFSAPPPEAASPTRVAPPAEPPPAEPPLADQPTDELGRPEERPRERTLAFSAPEMSQRPAGPVHVARTPRRWPWVLLALLPVLIITGTGIALMVLLEVG